MKFVKLLELLHSDTKHNFSNCKYKNIIYIYSIIHYEIILGKNLAFGKSQCYLISKLLKSKSCRIFLYTEYMTCFFPPKVIK